MKKNCLIKKHRYDEAGLEFGNYLTSFLRLFWLAS